MTSYEEMVVDQSVDAAWLDFRVRLADHIAAMDEGDPLQLGVATACGEHIVLLHVRAIEHGEILGKFVASDQQTQDGIRLRLGRRNTSVRVHPDEIDEFALAVHDILHLVAGAPHPSFVEVIDGALDLVDAPQQIAASAPRPELPESVTPPSHADLVEWVDRVLAERLGRIPKKLPDGSVGLHRDHDARLRVRVSSRRPIIEVSAVVATDVDVRKARKLVPKLNASFHYFSFALVGDRVTVATTVNAKPFCPEHLDRAIESTFDYLEQPAGEVRVKLARKAPKVQAADNAMDPDLLLIYGVYDDRAAMVQLARSLTGDSRSSLNRWRDIALEAGKTARNKASALERGPVQNALLEQYVAWRSVASAIIDAVEDIVVERETSR